MNQSSYSCRAWEILNQMKKRISSKSMRATSGPLRIIFQDGTLSMFLEFCPGDSRYSKDGVRWQENNLEKEIPKGVFHKLAIFNSFMGMVIEGFEKEIISLQEMMEARKGAVFHCWERRGNHLLQPTLRESSKNQNV